jgi:hypothetical protein
MAATVSIVSDYEPAEIDLWGAKYDTVDLAKKGFTKLTALQAEIDTLAYDDKAVETFIEKVGEFCDIKLVAQKGKTKASTLIKKEWDANHLTARQIASFIQRIAAAEAEANRPS